MLSGALQRVRALVARAHEDPRNAAHARDVLADTSRDIVLMIQILDYLRLSLVVDASALRVPANLDAAKYAAAANARGAPMDPAATRAASAALGAGSPGRVTVTEARRDSAAEQPFSDRNALHWHSYGPGPHSCAVLSAIS